MYPIVPLIPGGGLGIALFSYEGKLCWDFNGDYELVPDLSAFTADVQVAFEELRAAAVERYLSERTAPSEEVEEIEEREPDVSTSTAEATTQDTSESVVEPFDGPGSVNGIAPRPHSGHTSSNSQEAAVA